MAVAKFDIIEQYLDNNGALLALGSIEVYAAGTSTPQAVYTSNDEPPTPHEFPISLDASGRPPGMGLWFTKGLAYKVIIKDALGVTIKPIDKLKIDDIEALVTDALATIFFDQPFELLGPKPTSAEVIGLYVATRDQRFFGNFDGTSAGYGKAYGVCLTPPADGDYICLAYKNNTGSSVGSMTVGVDSSFAFATVSGAAIDLDAGEFIAWRAPVGVDSAGPVGMSWTITGINL